VVGKIKFEDRIFVRSCHRRSAVRGTSSSTSSVC
jgi:hypothetical protein